MGGKLAAFLAILLLSVVSLRAAANDQRLVVNAGRGGDTTQDLLARVEGDVLIHSPELIVLLAGTNDLLNSKKAVSLETYRDNLSVLVERMVAQNIKVLLVTIPPAHAPYLLKRHSAEFYGPKGPAARIAAGNGVIRQVASKYNLPVVELFDALQQVGGASERPESLIRNLINSGSEDGVHPTAEGYRFLAELVADAIGRESLQGVTRIVCFGDSITRGVHMSGEGTTSGDTYPAFLACALAQRYPPASVQHAGSK